MKTLSIGGPENTKIFISSIDFYHFGHPLSQNKLFWHIFRSTYTFNNFEFNYLFIYHLFICIFVPNQKHTISTYGRTRGKLPRQHLLSIAVAATEFSQRERVSFDEPLIGLGRHWLD